MASSLTSSAGLRFYREVSRCVPYLMAQFDLGEMTNKHAIRRVLAERFNRNRGEKNPDTVEMLIYKGRQELEEAMERFKTRNHIVNEWVYDPKERVRKANMLVDRGFSPFLEEFLQGNYKKPLVC